MGRIGERKKQIFKCIDEKKDVYDFTVTCGGKTHTIEIQCNYPYHIRCLNHSYQEIESELTIITGLGGRECRCAFVVKLYHTNINQLTFSTFRYKVICESENQELHREALGRIRAFITFLDHAKTDHSRFYDTKSCDVSFLSLLAKE